jgi:hypothetical protein
MKLKLFSYAMIGAFAFGLVATVIGTASVIVGF